MPVPAKPKVMQRPDWLKIRLQTGAEYRRTKSLLAHQRLATVCEEARCPNIYECWGRKTATIMILGETCTRACGFCAVKTGKPGKADTAEPYRTAMAVKEMGLRHVVITSVDRDDLKADFGAEIWAQTIGMIHQHVKGCTVEVLTPDFQGYVPSLQKIFKAAPEVFSHNVECIERISRLVRPQADWQRSKFVLKIAKEAGMVTKSGIMVGLGESDEEVLTLLKEIAELDVDIFTIGQYLQPTKSHLPVERFVHPDIFSMYKEEGLKSGLKIVESGPLVRSSYHADEQINLLSKIGT
ncbi:MAG: lipoyl synthase [FCB group bacterium]|nr:lipoyl synthase [FCB group bacterium]